SASNNKYSKLTKIQEVSINGAPRPTINKEFKNVKYIKIDNIILPQFKEILNDGSGFDEDSNLQNEKYILLRIKELDISSTNFYSTNDIVTNCTFMLFPNKTLGSSFCSCDIYYGTKVFPNSGLVNINKLTFEFLDSQGIPLNYSNLDSNLPPTDLQHPLNKFLQ